MGKDGQTKLERAILSEGDFYQNNAIKIIVGGQKLAEVVKKMQDILTKNYKEAQEIGVTPEEYEALDLKTKLKDNSDLEYNLQSYFNLCLKLNKRQRKHLEHNNKFPIHGASISHSETERMIGVADIKFSNGDTSDNKIITISGKYPLCFKESIPKDKSQFTSESIPANLTINGFKFINMGEPKGEAMDLSTGRYTSQSYSKGCAGQKIIKYASDYLNEHKGVTVNHIYMRETFWYAPDCVKQNHYSTIDAVPSCEKCKIVLAYATGKGGEKRDSKVIEKFGKRSEK